MKAADLITEHMDIWTSAQTPKANGGRGRNSANGQSNYGIKNLRELILELAVRGKLVPQDPGDLPAPQSGKYFVYALECDDKSIYIGQTDNVLKRWKTHAAGEGAEWTKKHPPVRLVHWEMYNSREEAANREKDLKTGFGRKWLKREIAAGRTRQAGEPASVLLEKIAKEKKRLVKEGKIKKQKPLQDVGEDEKPFGLPKGWIWVKLGEALIKITDGTHHSPPNGEYGDFLYISARNIKPEGVLLSNATYVNRETHDEIYSRCDPEYGDILYIKDGATTGVATINNLKEPFSMLSSVALLRAPESILNTYLLLSLKSPVFYNLMRSDMTGVAITRVTLTKLNNAFVSLPPLKEQQCIVAKVDQLMALCDQLEQQQTDSNEAHQTLVENLLATLTNAADSEEFAKAWKRIADHFDTLFTTEQSIDQLKQTILQLAVMGKLVPQESYDLPAPQPGKYFIYALECDDKSIYIGQTEDVLKRWKTHAAGEGAEWTKNHPPVRLVHWEMYDSKEEAVKREKELKTGFGRKWLKREIAAGRTRQAGEPASVLLEKIAKEKKRLVKEGKIKKEKPLPEIGEDEKPFELPEGWNFIRLSELSCLITKGSSPNWQGVAYTEDSDDILFVTSENVGSYELKLESRKYVEKRFNEVEPRSILHKGDFLMNIVGASIGRTAIYDIDDLANINQAVCLIRVFSKFIDSQFLLHFFNSEICVSYMFDKQVDNARANLSMGNIATFVVPFPPLAEQQRIVGKIDEIMALCDKLKALVNEAQTTQIQLADAMVEKAVA